MKVVASKIQYGQRAAKLAQTIRKYALEVVIGQIKRIKIKKGCIAMVKFLLGACCLRPCKPKWMAVELGVILVACWT